MKKVFVIGLDGVSFDVIKPWIEEGKLPTFKKLMDGGCYGCLKSTIPPVTVPAWPTMFTGLNSGKTGVFYFQVKKEQSYDFSYFNSSFWKGKAVWDITNNIKSAVINVPGTYPPWRINGIMVSGLLTPSKEKIFTYPRKLQDLLSDDYIIEPNHEKDDEIKKAFEERVKLVKTVLTKNFDLFVVVFRPPDITSHAKIRDFKERYFDCLKYIDSVLTELLPKIKNYNIFIASDHGVNVFERCFFINKWLENHKYLSLKPIPLKERITKTLIQKTRDFFHKHKLWVLRKILLRMFFAGRVDMKVSTPFDKEHISWGKTKAFSTVGGVSQFTGIFLNMKSNFPNGIVKEKDYETLREEIINNLNKLKKDGIIEKVWKREEIFNGEKIWMLPDIIVKTKEGIYVHPDLYSYKEGALYKNIPQHTMNGIFIAYGPDIKECGKISNAKILNVAPTILYALGLQKTKDMDEEPLKEIFKKDLESTWV